MSSLLWVDLICEAKAATEGSEVMSQGMISTLPFGLRARHLVAVSSNPESRRDERMRVGVWALA